MKFLFLSLFFLLLSPFYAVSHTSDFIPDSLFTAPHFCTERDNDFDGFRYRQRIAHCRRAVSQSVKREVYKSYKVPRSNQSDYTIDHLVPLSLGGSNRKLNLWPQHKSVNTAILEGHIFRQVRDDKLSIQEALNKILSIKYGVKIEISE